jgi:hypothetical protein
MKRMIRVPHLVGLAVLTAAAACAESLSTRDGGGDEAAGEPPETSDPSGDCAPGLADCGGTCVDTAASHDHCGACGNACESFEVCNGGACSLECPAGKVECLGGCVDVTTDLQHCGGCSRPCTAGLNATAECAMGVCDVRCESGWSDLDGDGSCETDCVPSSATEICNGIDDNCDGEVDEGFDCRMGHEVACTTLCGSTGSGICSLACSLPDPASCNPPGELCNGEDDDCNGSCDNGYDCCNGESGTCETACGSTGARQCSATCAWSSCAPPAETCNGADDDCDGQCDVGPGMACCAGATGSCSLGCGISSTRVCLATCVWDSCSVPPEACNGSDDNCDGTVDEGFRAAVQSTAYSTLRTFHGGCDGAAQRWGLECNSAIGRYCQSLGCYQSGFGPVENAGDGASVVCVAGGQVLTVPWSTLASYHGGCTGPAGITDSCNAAINRDCTAGGFAGGFGPVEVSMTEATIVCVRGGTGVGTTYTDLSGYHGDCNGTTQFIGPACNAAIHRYCAATGRSSGFGPTEHSGDGVSVVCVVP